MRRSYFLITRRGPITITKCNAVPVLHEYSDGSNISKPESLDLNAPWDSGSASSFHSRNKGCHLMTWIAFELPGREHILNLKGRRICAPMGRAR